MGEKRDSWKSGYIKSIISACDETNFQTDKELGVIIDKIYQDGFDDGMNEEQAEESPDTSLKEGLEESRG